MPDEKTGDRLRKLGLNRHLFMRILLGLSAFVIVSLVGAGSCTAMISIGDVSRERAKELGIEIRINPIGDKTVRVELAFKTDGVLKHFKPDAHSRVELTVSEGKKRLVTAPLRMRRPGPGQVVCSFEGFRFR